MADILFQPNGNDASLRNLIRAKQLAAAAVRRLRGYELVTKGKVQHIEATIWGIVSERGGRRYTVSNNPNTNAYRCTCPDFAERRRKCKHIYAVEFLREWKDNPGGKSAAPAKRTTEIRIKARKSYPQNWAAYDAAQEKEKELFQSLLHELCSTTVARGEQKHGRPRVPLCDAIYAATFKVYSTFSARRFMTDFRNAHRSGYISRSMHRNTIASYLRDPATTDVLKELIARSSQPMASLEQNFAVDATGIASSRFVRWCVERENKQRSDGHDWVKLHLICGVRTNVVASVDVSERHAHDSPYLPNLVARASKSFTLKEVSADKGYLSAENLLAIERAGAFPYISLKVNSKEKKKELSEPEAVLWNKVWHYYNFRRDEFLEHYHRRSNVESTFSMIKAKFGDAIRSKDDVAQVNETLCKVLCHNICVLIQSMHEFGITGRL